MKHEQAMDHSVDKMSMLVSHTRHRHPVWRHPKHNIAITLCEFIRNLRVDKLSMTLHAFRNLFSHLTDIYEISSHDHHGTQRSFL